VLAGPPQLVPPAPGDRSQGAATCCRRWPDTTVTPHMVPRALCPDVVPRPAGSPPTVATTGVATVSGHGYEGGRVMTTDRTQTPTDRTDGPHLPGARLAGARLSGGAAIHPRFLRSGPWALSSVVALLFGLSFATSYAALYDYALELQFPREFAIAFPLVLDAVIVVLAVTLLLERALGRRKVAVKGWQVTVRLPTWPLGALWCYFGGSVAGNVGHAPSVLAAQLVAAVPPVSAALTFHLLLRLLDRAPALRRIAESYEELAVDEQERAAARRARRARIKTSVPSNAAGTTSTPPPVSSAPMLGNGHADPRPSPSDRQPVNGRDGRPSRAQATASTSRPAGRSKRAADQDDLRRRVRVAIDNGEPVTGETVGRWLGLSARTGRRRLAALLDADPDLARAVNQDERS
jgi:predicted DNA-binding transcriptional regulator